MEDHSRPKPIVAHLDSGQVILEWHPPGDAIVTVDLAIRGVEGRETVFPEVVDRRTLYAVHLLLYVLHDGVPGVLNGTVVVRADQGSCDPGLWPEGRAGDTLHTYIQVRHGWGTATLYLHNTLITKLLTQETLVPVELALGALEGPALRAHATVHVQACRLVVSPTCSPALDHLLPPHTPHSNSWRGRFQAGLLALQPS